MTQKTGIQPKYQRQFERALDALDAGDNLYAIDTLESILRYSKNAEVALHLGVACAKQGLQKRAIESYETCLALSPGNESALCNLAMLLEQQGNRTQALELFRRALRGNPISLPALKGVAFHCYQSAKYEDSQGALDRIIQLDPQSTWALEQQGLLNYAQGKTEEAIEAYSNALAVDNNNGSVWNNLGNCHIKNLQVREAENAYRQAISADELNPDYWYNLGELLFHYATKAEAIEPFEQVVQLSPQDVEAWKFLAQAQADARPAEAEKSFLMVIELAGESVDHLSHMAELYAVTGEKDKEVKTRTRLSKLNPYDMENNFAIAQVRLTQGKPEIAYKLLQDCLTISEKEYETWFRLAQSFQLEQRLEEEFNCLEKVIKANPAHHAAWTRLGHVALAQDLPLKAYKYFIKAAPALKNDYSLWKLLMERLTEVGAIKEALDACDQVFELASYSPRIWDEFFRHFKRIHQEKRFLGWLEHRLFEHVNDAQYVLPFATLFSQFGHAELATRLYEHLIKQYPEYTEIFYQYAVFLVDQGLPEQARGVCLQGLKTNAKDYQLTLALGDSWYWESNYPEAKRQYEAALAQRRDDWRVWFSLGNVAARSGEFQSAVEMFSHSIEIYNLEPKSYFNRGLAFRKLGQPQLAEEDFVKCLKGNRKQAPAWSALGSLCRERQDLKRAAHYYKRALAVDRSYAVAWTNLGLVFAELGLEQQSECCYEQVQRLEKTP